MEKAENGTEIKLCRNMKKWLIGVQNQSKSVNIFARSPIPVEINKNYARKTVTKREICCIEILETGQLIKM